MYISRVARPLSLLVLAITLAGLFGVSSAGAANTALSTDCLSSGRTRSNIANGDTITWTLVGNGCSSVTFATSPHAGRLYGTLTVDGNPVSPGGFAFLSQGSTVVYTAPATGSDYAYIYFDGPGPSGPEYTISFPIVSGSFVDNGDGTVTITYTGAVFMAAFPQGTTCPLQTDLNNFYMVLNTLRDNESPVGVTSPYTQGADPMRVPAGVYEGCLYYPYLSDDVMQSGPIYIGQPAPTTTTTAGDDPVTPAFTG